MTVDLPPTLAKGRIFADHLTQLLHKLLAGRIDRAHSFCFFLRLFPARQYLLYTGLPSTVWDAYGAEDDDQWDLGRKLTNRSLKTVIASLLNESGIGGEDIESIKSAMAAKRGESTYVSRAQAARLLCSFPHDARAGQTANALATSQAQVFGDLGEREFGHHPEETWHDALLSLEEYVLSVNRQKASGLAIPATFRGMLLGVLFTIVTWEDKPQDPYSPLMNLYWMQRTAADELAGQLLAPMIGDVFQGTIDRGLEGALARHIGMDGSPESLDPLVGLLFGGLLEALRILHGHVWAKSDTAWCLQYSSSWARSEDLGRHWHRAECHATPLTPAPDGMAQILSMAANATALIVTADGDTWRVAGSEVERGERLEWWTDRADDARAKAKEAELLLQPWDSLTALLLPVRTGLGIFSAREYIFELWFRGRRRAPEAWIDYIQNLLGNGIRTVAARYEAMQSELEPSHIWTLSWCFAGHQFRRRGQQLGVPDRMTSPHEVATILAIPERRAGTPWHQLLHVEETSEFGPEKVQRLIEMAERDYLVAAGLIATEALHSEINAVLAAAQKWAAAATGKDPEEKQSAKAEWYQAGEELKAEKRPSGKQASVRGRLRDLLEPAGMTLSQANGAPAWVDVFLNDDMGMDFQHLGACLRLLFRNLTEHSENPSNCSVRGYLVADEQLVSIDLLLCLEDPRGPNEPMRAAEIFGGNGTVTRAAKDLEGAARFVVVQEAPQGRSDPGDPALPQKAEPIPWPGMPKPNRADLRHVHGASADGCFAFILEFPLPMSDKVLDSILQTSRRGPPLPMVWEVLIEADDVSGQGVSL